MPKFKVTMTKTTTTTGYWEIEADDLEAAEKEATRRLAETSEEPEEVDVSFGDWEVCYGEAEESAEVEKEE